MNSFKYVFLSGALLFLLSSCGFQLKGLGDYSLHPLPFTSLYLSGATGINTLVRENLSFDNRIKLLASPEKAQAQLMLYAEQARKDVLTINSSGKINQYLLIYRVSARLSVNGKPYGPAMQIRVRRTLNYADSEVLGKTQEEVLLWNDIHRDAAEQIIRRLSYQKPIIDKVNASASLDEASAPIKDAVTKP